ncbi:MAG: hypothetical protein Kow0077_25350 [Anaerolineae bacterium]
MNTDPAYQTPRDFLELWIRILGDKLRKEALETAFTSGLSFLLSSATYVVLGNKAFIIPLEVFKKLSQIVVKTSFDAVSEWRAPRRQVGVDYVFHQQPASGLLIAEAQPESAARFAAALKGLQLNPRTVLPMARVHQPLSVPDAVLNAIEPIDAESVRTVLRALERVNAGTAPPPQTGLFTARPTDQGRPHPEEAWPLEARAARG